MIKVYIGEKMEYNFFSIVDGYICNKNISKVNTLDL